MFDYIIGLYFLPHNFRFICTRNVVRCGFEELVSVKICLEVLSIFIKYIYNLHQEYIQASEPWNSLDLFNELICLLDYFFLVFPKIC